MATRHNEHKHISARDLARICGVSKSTVDRALNGKGRVAEETRLRIMAAAKQMGYRPNPAIRENFQKCSKTIGMAIPPDALFGMEFFERAKKTLRSQGYHIFLSTTYDHMDLEHTLDEFAARRFAATIVLPNIGIDHIDTSRLGGMKILSLFHKCEGQGVAGLLADESQVSVDAVKHLHDRGHTRMLFLSYPFAVSWSARMRRDGFMQATKLLGIHGAIQESIPVHSPLIQAGWSNELGHAIDPLTLERCLSSHAPTAIICGSLALALRLKAMQGTIQQLQAVEFLSITKSSQLTWLLPDIPHSRFPIDPLIDQIVPWIEGSIDQPTMARYTLTRTDSQAHNTHPNRKEITA